MLEIDWPSIIVHLDNINYSLHLETKINNLIDKYMTLKNFSKKEIKQHNKPWATSGIRKLMRRDKLYKKFIKTNNQEIRNTYHHQYKELRNKLVPRCRVNKKARNIQIHGKELII